ncbi:MAG: biotin/lipoyl-containing protein, partial [Acidimicrobiales bacterium]
AIGYDSAGTVEFIVDDETGDYFFLEMNTRLQVEHPVTEAVTGLDLVELMIGSASGDPLPIDQNDVTHEGHAIEARINAEDPAQDFAPQVGTVSTLRIPPGVRWDAAIEEGSEVSPHYDAMVAKLIVHGPDRPTALASLARALDALILGGVATNTGFHRWLVGQAPVVEGRVTTRFLDETTVPTAREVPAAAELAAGLLQTNRRSIPEANPWKGLHSFALTPARPERSVLLRGLDGEVYDAEPRFVADVIGVAERNHITVNVDGHSHYFTVVDRSTHWAPATEDPHGSAGAILSPFPAVVAEVHAEPGQEVASGEVLVVIEAMKMLHSLKSAGPGVVAEVRVAPGDQVASNQLLVTFADH